jgi:hypothetical protein
VVSITLLTLLTLVLLGAGLVLQLGGRRQAPTRAA